MPSCDVRLFSPQYYFWDCKHGHLHMDRSHCKLILPSKLTLTFKYHPSNHLPLARIDQHNSCQLLRHFYLLQRIRSNTPYLPSRRDESKPFRHSEGAAAGPLEIRPHGILLVPGPLLHVTFRPSSHSTTKTFFYQLMRPPLLCLLQTSKVLPQRVSSPGHCCLSTNGNS